MYPALTNLNTIEISIAKLGWRAPAAEITSFQWRKVTGSALINAFLIGLP